MGDSPLSGNLINDGNFRVYEKAI